MKADCIRCGQILTQSHGIGRSRWRRRFVRRLRRDGRRRRHRGWRRRRHRRLRRRRRRRRRTRSRRGRRRRRRCGAGATSARDGGGCGPAGTRAGDRRRGCRANRGRRRPRCTGRSTDARAAAGATIDRRVVSERRLQAGAVADRNGPERTGHRLGEHLASRLGRVEPIAAQHPGCLGDHSPVDDGDVVVLGAEPTHDVVDLCVVRSVLGDREEQRRARCEPVEDHAQLGLVLRLIAAVVAPEEHHCRIPVLAGRRVTDEQLVEDPVPEVDESARLGLTATSQPSGTSASHICPPYLDDVDAMIESPMMRTRLPATTSPTRSAVVPSSFTGGGTITSGSRLAGTVSGRTPTPAMVDIGGPTPTVVSVASPPIVAQAADVSVDATSATSDVRRSITPLKRVALADGYRGTKSGRSGGARTQFVANLDEEIDLARTGVFVDRPLHPVVGLDDEEAHECHDQEVHDRGDGGADQDHAVADVDGDAVEVRFTEDGCDDRHEHAIDDRHDDQSERSREDERHGKFDQVSAIDEVLELLDPALHEHPPRSGGRPESSGATVLPCRFGSRHTHAAPGSEHADRLALVKVSLRQGPDEFDLVVIGMGSAGILAAELAAHDLGLRVAAVDRARFGGDCLWTGCVPSKALVARASGADRSHAIGRTTPRLRPAV